MKGRKVYLILSLALIAIVVSFSIVACASGSSTREITANQTEQTEELTNFIERNNINRRYQLFDNPSQISWIYCLGDEGNPIFYGEVMGKVTSSNKRLESNLKGRCNSSYCWVDEAISVDGTFGSSDSYVFWFDSAGNYYQWNGKYFLTSVPIPLDAAVLNVRDVTVEENEGGE